MQKRIALYRGCVATALTPIALHSATKMLLLAFPSLLEARLGATRPTTLTGKRHSARSPLQGVLSEVRGWPLRDPLRDTPLEGHFPSQSLSGLLPLCLLPLNLSLTSAPCFPRFPLLLPVASCYFAPVFRIMRSPYRIQSPLKPENTPENTLQNPKYRQKCQKIHIFPAFTVLRCILGCILGFEGFCILIL